MKRQNNWAILCFLVRSTGWGILGGALWALCRMSISNYLENKLLDATFNSTAFNVTGDPWVSLHTADPGETGASEVAGGSYVRQQAAFSAAASGAVTNNADIDFTLMPSCTITHAGVWDEDGTPVGNFLWGGALGASKVVNSGDTVRVPAGDLDVTLD